MAQSEQSLTLGVLLLLLVLSILSLKAVQMEDAIKIFYKQVLGSSYKIYRKGKNWMGLVQPFDQLFLVISSHKRKSSKLINPGPKSDRS